jgi:hypothetical protein
MSNLVRQNERDRGLVTQLSVLICVGAGRR